MMRIIRRGVPVDQHVTSKRVHGDAIFAQTALKMSMRQDELRRITIIAQVPCKRRPAHSNLDIFPDLQMQMCII